MRKKYKTPKSILLLMEEDDVVTLSVGTDLKEEEGGDDEIEWEEEW